MASPPEVELRNKLHRLGIVKREDEDVQEHEACHGRVTVSDTAREGASDEDADERTELSRHLKRRLPLGHDDPVPMFPCCGVPYTVNRRRGGIVSRRT